MERLLRFSKSEKILQRCELPVSSAKKQKKKERHKQWKENQLHGKFARETEEVRIGDTWGWIRKGYLKKETEGFIFAAQEQALRTNWIRKNIDGQEVSKQFRMCGERDESITHLNADCKKLAQKECKQRHDNIARIVRLELYRRFSLVCEVKWYNHKPASVVENDRVKIFWNFNIQIDHAIQHRRPDIVVLYKSERRCHLVDIAVPWYKRIQLKKQEKIVSYSELRREVKKIWNLSQAGVVPVVIGALRVTSKSLKDLLKKLDVKSSRELLQKAALLETAKIVRHS